MIRNISEAPNQLVRMICEGSWVILNSNISQYYIHCITDQINAENICIF